MVITEIDEFYQGGGLLDLTRPIRFKAPVNICDRVEFNPSVSGDNAQHFFELGGQLPASPDAAVDGVLILVTSSGAAFFPQRALQVGLAPGYTGAASTIAVYVNNNAAGVHAGGVGGGNIGLACESFGVTVGHNTGLFAEAGSGSTNFGLAGRATTAKASATNIGVLGRARNTGGSSKEVGGHFDLGTAEVVYESAGVVCDNGSTASPVVLARDNAVRVWGIEDGGSIQGKMGTKTLTETVATAFVRISVPQGTCVGGHVIYTVEANDGTDFQIRSGILPFAAVNKAGAETGAVATVSTATETVAVSVGTLTNNGFTIPSNAADTVDISANFTSSLAQTTLRINYRVEMYGNAVVTVTPL